MEWYRVGSPSHIASSYGPKRGRRCERKSLRASSAWARVTGQANEATSPGRPGSVRCTTLITSRMIGSGSMRRGGGGRGLGPPGPKGRRFSLSKFQTPPMGVAALPMPSIR